MYNETKFNSFTWIDLTSPTKTEFEKVSQEHNLDLLLVSDSLEPGHLPKIEIHDDTTFILLRVNDAGLVKKAKNILTVQDMTSKMAIFIKNDVLITVHRIEFPFLANLQKPKERQIQEVILSLMSSVIESYARPANVLSNHIDEIEKRIFLKNLKKVSLEKLYFLKSEARISKKLLTFTQQALNQFKTDEEYMNIFQDVKESLIKVLLEYDEVLEDSNNLMNTYISVNSNHANDIMKVLTVFSAFFLPLTFMAGIYGMNFDYMPELKIYYGYPALLGSMALVVIIILIWFKSKKII